MPVPDIAWSWSRLTCFEKCPRQFFEKNVSKSVPFVTNATLERGKRLHDMMEGAILKREPIHDKISHMTPVIESIHAVDWDVIDVESENTLRRDMTSTSWFGKDAWLRVKMDFTGIKGTKAVNMDWKTGKNYGYSDQLKLYAGFVMHKWDFVQEVDTGFIYMDHRESATKVWKRRQLNAIWDDFEERVELIQIANQSGIWEPKPSKFNCAWCPVDRCKARATPYKG